MTLLKSFGRLHQSKRSQQMLIKGFALINSTVQHYGGVKTYYSAGAIVEVTESAPKAP